MNSKGVEDGFIIPISTVLLFTTIFIFSIFFSLKAEAQVNAESVVIEDMSLTLMSLLNEKVDGGSLNMILMKGFYEDDYDEFDEIIKGELNKLYEGMECNWQITIQHDGVPKNILYSKEPSTRNTAPIKLSQEVEFTKINVPIIGKPKEELEVFFKEIC